MKKYLPYIALAISLIALGVVLVGNNQSNLGADVANTRYPHGIDVTENGCYAVDGTCVIDSSGNYDGAITATTGTFSSTLTVTGETTVDVLNANGGSGSGVFASTTMETTATALASYVTDYSYWALTPNVANTALTLPATSTLSTFIATAGQCHTIKIENTSAVSATTTTIVAGAGMDLQEPDGQNVVIGGTNYANIEFCRRSDTDMVVTVTETIPAD